MASKKKGLGRGLSAMLSEKAIKRVETPRAAEQVNALRDIPLEQIKPGRYQPRSVFDQDKLAELAASIKSQGVVQPIVVRPVGMGEYEIIAGERRWRAAQQAGLEAIPAVVREVDDEMTIAMALIENIQREDLNPLEEAAALQRLINEFDMTHKQAAEAVGRSRAAVSNLLRLLELVQDVKDMVDARHLEMGHARALLALDADQQTNAAHEVVAKKLSVRQTEQLVRRLQQGSRGSQKLRKDPDITRLENELAETLCAKVAIQHQSGGKGKLVIQYNSTDELDGILAHIK